MLFQAQEITEEPKLTKIGGSNMTPEFKALWLKRLTDGTYIRALYGLVDLDATGTPVLTNGAEGRCCLGVARQVAVELNLLPPISNMELKQRPSQFLNDEELKVIGLEQNTQNTLSCSNDNLQIEVKPGQFYPDEVIDRVKAIPTE